MSQILSVKKGSSTLFQKTLSRGWTPLGASLAAYLFPASGNVWLSNGFTGEPGGTVFFDRIELREWRWGAPRVFGNGNECLIPRGSFRMRKGFGLHATPDFGFGGAARIPFAPSLRALSPWWAYAPNQLGMYTVCGEKQRDAPGGRGIEPLSGFEGDLAGIQARCDATMNRSPLDAFQPDGAFVKPLTAAPGYSDDVGWQKSTQLPQFCVPLSSNIYDERRRPREWNTGTCAYYPELAGHVNPYDSYLPQNQQHGVRTLAPVIAAANCGDEMAQMALDVIAHNASLAVAISPTVQPGMGSTYYGTRAAAWRMLAWMHSAPTAARATAHAIGMTAAQMPNGGFMSQPSPAWFSPDPWNNYGLDKAYSVDASMERWLTCHVLAQAGETQAVRRALAGVFDTIVPIKGYVPKFIAVAVNGVPLATTTVGVGPPDYFPWVALGALAALEPHAVDWQRWALSIGTPSQGKGADLRDLRNRLRNEQLGRSQCVAMLSVLETMGL